MQLGLITTELKSPAAVSTIGEPLWLYVFSLGGFIGYLSTGLLGDDVHGPIGFFWKFLVKR